MRDNPMKKKLAAGESALGVWACLGSEVTLEVAARLGFDWALIDCEHGLVHTEGLLPLLRAAAGHDMATVVRMPSAHALSDFKRVLDMGAEGVLVPMVRSAEEVSAVVAQCKYPPAGTRGIASHRAHGYGVDFMDTFQRANDNILIAVQIETAEAMEHLEAIAAVEGLDALFVGPSDLSAALGKPFDTDSDDFQRAVDRVLATCKATGKPAGIYCRSPDDAKRWLARGFSFVNICNDQSTLVSGIRRSLKQMRD